MELFISDVFKQFPFALHFEAENNLGKPYTVSIDIEDIEAYWGVTILDVGQETIDPVHLDVADWQGAAQAIYDASLRGAPYEVTAKMLKVTGYEFTPSIGNPFSACAKVVGDVAHFLRTQCSPNTVATPLYS